MYIIGWIVLRFMHSGDAQIRTKEAVRLLDVENITHFFGVPPMFRLILKVLKTKKLVLSALKYCCSSSLEISYDLIKGVL